MPKQLRRRLFYAGVFIIWLCTMSVLVFNHYRPFHVTQKTTSPVVLPEELFGEQWMGVYFKGNKIGHSRRQFEKTGSGYRVSETLDVDMKIMGAQKKIETVTEVLLSADLSLMSFQTDLKGDTGIKVLGDVQGRDLRVTIVTAGGRMTRIIPLKERPSLSLSLVPNILKDGVTPGRRFSVPVIDPASLSQEIVPIEVAGKEKIAVSGNIREAYRLKGSSKNTDFSIWVTEKGEVLKEEGPMGFTLLREEKEEALRKGAAASDLSEEAAVAFTMKLPTDVHYLKLRVSGIDLNDFEVEGGRQHRKDNIVEIRKEDLDGPSLRWRSEGKNKEAHLSPEYLQDTPFVQSKDPQITALARKIIGSERGRLTASRRIYNWVYANVEKTPAPTLPMATEVLRTKKGDCNEHTTLFTALARASGIPARMALGLVYKDGAFYYHAWPEIFSGDWIAVDPTLGQFPADAAHIRIITGDIDQQLKLIKVIGKIKIEGIEYR
jgi:hypothetical protein